MPLTRRQLCRYLAAGAFSLHGARASSPLAQVIASARRVSASGPLLLAATSKGAVSTFTTSAINSTGATLIVVGFGWYGPSGEPTLSDSQGNTWSNLTSSNFNSAQTSRLKYCINPSTSASHTFTSTGTNTYNGMTVAAFSGITAYDSRENGLGKDSSTSNATGSVTPTADNALLVTHLSLAGNAQTPTIDNSFSIATHLGGVSGTNYGADLAYLVLATAAAKNPTWGWGTSAVSVSRIAVFR